MEQETLDKYIYDSGGCYFASIMRKIGINAGLLTCWLDEYYSFLERDDITHADEKYIYFRWPYRVIEREFLWDRKTQKELMAIMAKAGVITRQVIHSDYGTTMTVAFHREKLIKMRKELRKK